MENLLELQIEDFLSSYSLANIPNPLSFFTQLAHKTVTPKQDPLLHHEDKTRTIDEGTKGSDNESSGTEFLQPIKPRLGSAKPKLAGKDEDYQDPELEKSIFKALALADQHGLIDFKQLPEPWRINRCILRGYRFTKSKRDTALSFFYLSNETFNIWSHAVGVMLIAAFALFIRPPSSFRGDGGSLDVWVAAIYFSAAIGCMLCSVVWHTAKSIADAKAMTSFVAVDMMGISIIITASFIMTSYTAFYGDPFWQRIYMTTSLLGGIAGLVLPWTSLFRRRDFALIKIDTSRIPITRAWIRVIFFTWLGVQGMIIPFLHLTLTQGFASTLEFFKPLVAVYVPVFVGAAIYAARFPEAWFPGYFDYFGASHNLWHIAVLIGVLKGCGAISEMYKMAWQRAAMV
jgi:adiponectin receptor